jgi:hypothetical protein
MLLIYNDILAERRKGEKHFVRNQLRGEMSGQIQGREHLLFQYTRCALLQGPGPLESIKLNVRMLQ